VQPKRSRELRAVGDTGLRITAADRDASSHAAERRARAWQ
jgi:hypothetical protein